MTQLKFPIVIYQKPTILETFFTIIIISITFIPFIYGIETKRPIFCISLFLGLICFKIFNITTKGKFTIPKIIQKDKTISFSDSYIEITENQNTIVHKWSYLEQVQINIFAYKGRYHHDQRIYDGIENSIKFIEYGQKFKYRFYIENVNQFNSLKIQFNKTILPLLKQQQNITEEDYWQTQFHFNRLNEDEID